ncbi:hypothetical protein SORBI_3002G250900 [Sorghum bicolor]|uniref:TMV response-related protein n=1 Tax=Sorghum bicolor TaxID=4558 RepID=A0A1W0W5M5_SORBI|nr:hypothetical protein SORBI_3002G250900 [Sorghum bicolor]
MGACVSFSRSPPASSAPEPEASQSQRTAATVKVVNLDGSMAQLAAGPVTAREALAAPAPAPGDDGGRHRASSSPPPPPRVFLCSADELGFDAPPRALAAGEALQPGQLYFVLPASALRRPLSANDMAALAVRAATALAAAGGLSPRRDKQGGATQASKRRRRSTARVAPLLVAVSSKEGTPDGDGARKNDDGERTVGKTRKRAAGYRTGGSRRRAVVQRLSAIAEDGE